MPQPASFFPVMNQPPANTNEDAHALRVALRKYEPLVDRVLAREVRRLPRCVDPSDLHAAGMGALLAAIRKSVHSSEEMFVAYAKIRVRGAIMDELRRLDWSPRRRKAEPEGSSASAGEVAPVRIVALSDLDDHNGILREGTDRDSPLDAIIRKREDADLRTAVLALSSREAAVIRMRYFEEMPSKQIAAVMLVSEARVSQINATATRKLRALLEDQGLRPAVAA